MAQAAQPTGNRYNGAAATRRANGNWGRYRYGRDRGHRDYIRTARRNDRFYIGAGLQWEQSDILALAETNRRPAEQNEILQMVNTAIGYQIANRMDISLRPRGRGADEESAKVMGKVVKQVADDVKLHWVETEVFGDGMIMQRGYYDVRISFDRNVYGEIDVTSLDPLDVIPDPDARSYDPESWADVIIDRWWSLEEIEKRLGKKARDAVSAHGNYAEVEGETDQGEERRPRFGDVDTGVYEERGYGNDEDRTVLYHVIDRQYYVYEMTKVAVWPSGDIRPVPDATKNQLAAYIRQGAMITKRLVKRVKWLVTTCDTVLFDDYSPYPWFTVVPYFPFFRRGQTRGMVDNAISIQEALNKAISQFEHIQNTTANSGYVVEQNSITNMSLTEFERKAAQNGLIIEYKKGSAKPERIEPPSIPSGIVEMIGMYRQALQSVTGMEQSLTSAGPMNEMSGVAYQARQYAAQQKLAIPLDNLARTRHMVAQRILDLIQMFYDAHRVMRITETDPYGNEVTEELSVNEPMWDEAGQQVTDYLNDLTLGEYDLVISEQPMQVTFDNTQFEQVRTLVKDMGYPIPPAFALRYSTLADKAEIAKAVEEAQKVQPDPELESKVLLNQAKALALQVDTMNKRIEAVYGATQAGVQIATVPGVAALADEVLQSAGFDDQNASPIIPQGQPIGAGLAQMAPDQALVQPPSAMPENTNPMTPANPGVGLHAGIEKAGAEPVPDLVEGVA